MWAKGFLVFVVGITMGTGAAKTPILISKWGCEVSLKHGVCVCVCVCCVCVCVCVGVWVCVCVCVCS